MAHYSTDISTKCGRKVLFKKSSKSVTGFSGVLMFKDALKKSTFVQNICDTVNYWFPRDSIFYPKLEQFLYSNRPSNRTSLLYNKKIKPSGLIFLIQPSKILLGGIASCM